MSIWMLLVFAICMLTAVLSFKAPFDWGEMMVPMFLATFLVFVAGVAKRGLRRPVV